MTKQITTGTIIELMLKGGHKIAGQVIGHTPSCIKIREFDGEYQYIGYTYVARQFITKHYVHDIDSTVTQTMLRVLNNNSPGDNAEVRQWLASSASFEELIDALCVQKTIVYFETHETEYFAGQIVSRHSREIQMRIIDANGTWYAREKRFSLDSIAYFSFDSAYATMLSAIAALEQSRKKMMHLL